MPALRKLLNLAIVVLLFSNFVIYICAVITFIDRWVGPLKYVLWILIAPALWPVMIVLPWFDAWVRGTVVQEDVLFVWLLLLVSLGLKAVYIKRSDKIIGKSC